jgi:hypothetical protein
MTTVDAFLKSNIAEISQDTCTIPNRDKRILISLSKQLNSRVFLTENQGKLLVKIIKENLIKLLKIDSTASDVINSNQWSENFRVVKKIKKIYISSVNPELITVEFSFNTRLKDKVISINAGLDHRMISSDSMYHIPLSEKAIKLLVETFLPEDFEIDEKILNFYQEIAEISTTATELFSILDEKNENLRNFVKNDLKDGNLKNLLLLHDRKIRYQYKISEKIEENSLSAKIALRNNRKVFINSSKFSLTTVIQSLTELKRSPIMVIFEGHDSKVNKQQLSILNDALICNNLTDKVGIYFRFEKNADSENFNAEISRLGYNKMLDDHTTVVGIANNKLPKFLLKNKWKPQTVISFTTAFKNNRSAVYCADSDLIIYYGDKSPLNEEIDVLL